MKNRIRNLKERASGRILAGYMALKEQKGEGFVDTAIKILMAVVIGALVLAGLYALFDDGNGKNTENSNSAASGSRAGKRICPSPV